MRRVFVSSYSWAREMAHQPVKVLWIALACASVGVVLDGTAIRLWSLHRDNDSISTRISDAKKRSHEMDFKIHQALSPEFIERAARDQFDLVKEGDLVFIFSDNVSETPENTASLFN